MKSFDKAHECSYRIHWSSAERGYVATVAEFPALHSTAAPTPFGAYHALVAVVEQKLLDADPVARQ